MAKVSFSDLKVRRLRAPLKGQRSYWDETLPGFGLRVSQGGAKTWVVLDPRARNRTQETIGRYPVVSLQEARGEAKRRLAESVLGKHRPRAIGWNTAVDEYLSEGEWKARTRSDYERLLKGYKFGKVCDVRPDQIETNRETFPVLRAFFNWCYSKHYVSESPMERMRPPSAYKSRERILSDEELGKVWNACSDDTFGRIVKLLILTGQRRGEITGLTAEMISGDRVTFPASLTKNGKEHTFPLGALAREQMKLPLAYRGFSKAKARLDKVSGVSGYTLHDLRRTFASGLASKGVPLHVIEKLLNHISGSFKGIVGVYQRYDFMPEMTEAIQIWEAHVLRSSQPETQKAPLPEPQASVSVISRPPH